MNRTEIWNQLGYYGTIYLVIMAVLVIGQPIAEQITKPIAAMVFPINENTSLMRNLVINTVMYWGLVGFYLAFVRKPPQS